MIAPGESTHPRSAPERIAAALLAALWLICAWRAATQSIVHDEALTYQFYLAGPSSELFTHFDANHHFLNTLLMRLSTALGGFSPLAMRVPALMGAGLFFAALYRFCRWACGSGWLLLIAVAAVGLNPFILDFMVAARGYGLALGLWMWALALLGPELDAGAPAYDRKSILIAGACAALSVTANLIFVPPVAVLTAIVIWFSARRTQNTSKTTTKRARNDQKTRDRKTHVVWVDFLAPAAAIALAFLLLAPLEHAAGEHFYAGTSSIVESLQSLGAGSLEHSGPQGYQSFMSQSHAGLVSAVLALVFVAGGAIAALRSGSVRLILTAIPACGSALLILMLHFALNMPYPLDRTGIYFIPAATLTLIALATIDRRVFAASLTVAGVMIGCFAIQFNSRLFYVWSYDADTDRIAERLAQMAKTKPALNVVTSWQLEPALNFYRQTRHYDQLSPFTRRPVGPGFDVYVLTPQDRAFVRDLELTVVYTGPASKTVIATVSK